MLTDVQEDSYLLFGADFRREDYTIDTYFNTVIYLYLFVSLSSDYMTLINMAPVCLFNGPTRKRIGVAAKER